MKLLRVKNFAHLFGIVWILSIVSFVGIVIFGIKDGKVITEQYSTVLVFTVITGLFAFLGALVLYLIHFLFLRKKPVVGTPRSPRMGISPMVLVLILFLMMIGGGVAVLGAYNLGQADKLMETTNTPESVTNDAVAQPSVTNSMRYVETAQPTNQSVVQEEQKSQQSNLAPCYVYGQTFNLTPEKCRYYQSEEAGANKAGQDNYVPPYQNYGNSSTPVPTSTPEKYHSTQEECRKSCYATYKNYPDTSLFKQQCVNSCQ